MKPRNMGGNDNDASKGNRHGGDGKGEKAGVSVDSVAEPAIQLAEASAPTGEDADRVARENRKPERKSDGQPAPAAEEKSTPAREAGDAAAEETGRHDREGRERRGEGHEGREGRGEGRGEGREGRDGSGNGAHNDRRHGAESRDDKPIDFSRWGRVLTEMEMKYPSAPQITIGNGTASATLGNFGNARASDKYSFDASDGILTPSSLYASAEKAGKLRGWIYAFHTGTPGGIVTRIIWFLSALLGASLPLTGYYIWIRRLVLKRRGAKARAAGTKN